MQLEDYFDFISDTVIRLKGTRIELEDIVLPYKDGQTISQLLKSYPSVNAEQLFATLLYYHTNKETVEEYLKGVDEAWTAYKQELDVQNKEFYAMMRERFAKFKASQEVKAG
jgi:uncharacterized protein (DUF433 family)